MTYIHFIVTFCIFAFIIIIIINRFYYYIKEGRVVLGQVRVLRVWMGCVSIIGKVGALSQLTDARREAFLLDGSDTAVEAASISWSSADPAVLLSALLCVIQKK